MSGPGAHLKDDEFAALMLGLEPSPAAAAHLAGCAQCRAEMQGFSSAVSDLGAAGLAWSKAHEPAGWSPRTQPQRRQPLFGAAGWALATAALAGVAVVPLVRHQRPAAEAVAVVQAPDAVEDSEAQIAQDNKLLQDVSMAIRANDAAPYSELGLEKDRAGHGSAGLRTRMQ